MIRLKSPVEGEPQPVDACLDEIQRQYQVHGRPATRSALNAHWNTIKTRVEHYIDHRGDVTKIGPSPFRPVPTTSPASAIANAGDLLFKRYDRDDVVRTSIVAHAKRVMTTHCPYCGLGMSEKPRGISHDRDHVLPRSKYPEYSLLRVNLVISCDDCNKVKKAQDVDSSGERLFVHPYFDEFLNEACLDASATATERGTPKIGFSVRATRSPATAALVNRHATALDLWKRYDDEPLREAVRLLEAHAMGLAEGETDLDRVRVRLRRHAARDLTERPSDPLCLILGALAESPDLEAMLWAAGLGLSSA